MNAIRRRAIEQAQSLTRDVAAELGLEIVEFDFHDQGRHSRLRVDVDRAGVPGVTLADCERLSRALDTRLDAIEGLQASYELQVSSPGLDRPIRSDDDIRRNTGRDVRLQYRDEAGRVVEGRGVLAGPGPDGSVRLVTPDGERAVFRDRILLMKQDVNPSGSRQRRP